MNLWTRFLVRETTLCFAVIFDHVELSKDLNDSFDTDVCIDT